jgi:hypothetical protein
MRFPHANNEEMDDRDFVARWAAWFAGPSAPGLVDARESVPMLHSTVALQTLLDQGRGHGLGGLCRKMVRPPYRTPCTRPPSSWLRTSICLWKQKQ